MTPSAEEIQSWLVRRVSDMAGVRPEEIDVRRPIRRYGLDSVALARLAFGLEDWLGYRFQENPLDQHPTIEALSQYLAKQVAKCK
jgi:acyl carrier protein